MKTFYRMDNIGTAKYTVSKNDGVSTHKDGSLFFDIAIFKNKIKLKRYIQDLLNEGYVQSMQSLNKG